MHEVNDFQRIDHETELIKHALLLTPSSKHNETYLVWVAGFYLFSLVHSVTDIIIV